MKKLKLPIRHSFPPANKKGFTLIELAIVLVIIGIILGAVLKGQDLINNAKAKRIQNDVRGIEAMLWTYNDRKHIFPGDCNSDGIYAYTPPLGAVGTATPPSNDPVPTIDYCAASTTIETINTPYSDLRVARIASYSAPNIVLAKHLNSDFYKIGSTAAIAGVQYNVIVAYGLPAWLAKLIDVSIDGTEDGSLGRVRNYSTLSAGSAWPTDLTNDTLVSLAYFFDKYP